jgi:hypothetical protein
MLILREEPWTGRLPGLTRDEVVAKIAPDNGPPVHAKGDAGLAGLFVNPWAAVTAGRTG